ncbi:MAG: hypothetical protein R2849_08715 [Thermomicrobiales bacterium]
MVSVGGEIGEVGSENSTVAELVAFMEHFNGFMEGDTNSGLSKISVQTGTSHGGVPLPDGTVADVAVDFKTLGDLSEVAPGPVLDRRRRPAWSLDAAGRSVQSLRRSECL